jgi:GNAT superfamily N-acetyltransferase
VDIIVRPADEADLPALGMLYRGLEEEMTALKPIWRFVDGLPDPADEAMAGRLADAAWHIYVAELDGVPVGMLAARDEELLPQADGERLASVRLLFTDADARGVGVGEALMVRFMDDARGRGIAIFDAHVSPGHRLAKNFFEAHGFKARSIIMHRGDR